MLKSSLGICFLITLSGFYSPAVFAGGNKGHVQPSLRSVAAIDTPKLKTQLKLGKWPADLSVTSFSGPDLTPSPACIAVAPTGEVYVGVDMIGSLGKTQGKGHIVRLVDSDHDGKIDQHTAFADVDDPRGIFVLGDRVFVLHTDFSKETGKATGMSLVVFEDKNGDGIADGPAKPLVENLSNAHMLAERGTDHATNGIRMGIDGWIYIAVGDFGFHDAIDRSGKKLTMLGGGVVRVRPDGTELEIYSHGTRNIYDIAIDAYMNIYTRDNTNDGGGWNIRFSHQLQSGEYGYPMLFQNFTDEILPALEDLGGGSGTGALFMDEPAWPQKYNHVPMMADWGRSELYIHRLSKDGASFKEKQEDFIELPQITDLDVDGSGILYLSAWDGAGYSGSDAKGFVVRAVPSDWKYKKFPDLKGAAVPELAALLNSASAVTRFYASQEMLLRPQNEVEQAVLGIIENSQNPLYARVAALYTFAQISGQSAMPKLIGFTHDATLREHALRALTDRKAHIEEVPLEPFLNALNDTSERVRAAAIIGIGRLGNIQAANALLNIKVPAGLAAPAKNTEGPHATPNSPVILPHLAVRSLIALNAVNQCVNAVGTANSTLALWALRYMYAPEAVDGLIKVYKTTKSRPLKKQILQTLARLYKKEASYDASWWWGTRPDSHGPFYKGVVWESSPKIAAFLKTQKAIAGPTQKQFFADMNARYRMEISEFGGDETMPVAKEAKIDLDKIKSKKGQIGKSSIEDIMLAMAKIKGDPMKGTLLFSQQGCIACHSLKKGEKLKGPFMGQIGSIMTRQQIAESILKPSASISQGFATIVISAKGNKNYTGFITEESAEKIVMRDIGGNVYTIKAADIISRKELKTSMMPVGLANALSFEDFASLITFLSQQKN